MSRWLLLAGAFAVPLFSVIAQEPEAVTPPKAAEVRITFIPPPIEGTISLGAYDAAGKLVRVLKSEATDKDFVVGLNGFITSWDGKNDQGAAVPPGTYSIRGYAVGALEIEGVAYHCNEWVTGEEAPRIRKLLPGGGISPNESFRSPVELADGNRRMINVSLAGGPEGPQIQESTVEPPVVQSSPAMPEGAVATFAVGTETFAHGSGKLWRRKGQTDWSALELPQLGRVIHACAGSETLWVIDSAAGGEVSVREYSPKGELLRELEVPPDGPVPIWIAARGRDDIYLLEESPTEQRARVLSREGEQAPVAAETGSQTSIWKTRLSRSIRFPSSFAAVSGALGRPQPFEPEQEVKVRLLPNPLFKNTSTEVTFVVGVNDSGLSLKTRDGLPLTQLTETMHLQWAVMGREKGSKAVTVFQSDGAVVEEFRVRKLANMMSFDAGEYVWPPKGAGH